jgi:predicted nucleic acid-binding protein
MNDVGSLAHATNIVEIHILRDAFDQIVVPQNFA